jgi:mono/diheme cytochrome c family protein
MPGSSKIVRYAAIASIAILAVVAAAYGYQHFQPSPERGASLYGEHCAACHGVERQGQPDWRKVNAAGLLPAPPLDGTGHGWRHSDAELLHMIKFSVLDQAGPGYKTGMPAFGGKLSDRDIRSILAFIKSRWPSGIQAAQSFLNPDHAGMPDHVDGDWRLPADCDEPVRGAPVAPQSEQRGAPSPMGQHS